MCSVAHFFWGCGLFLRSIFRSPWAKYAIRHTYVTKSLCCRRNLCEERPVTRIHLIAVTKPHVWLKNHIREET